MLHCFLTATAALTDDPLFIFQTDNWTRYQDHGLSPFAELLSGSLTLFFRRFHSRFVACNLHTPLYGSAYLPKSSHLQGKKKLIILDSTCLDLVSSILFFQNLRFLVFCDGCLMSRKKFPYFGLINITMGTYRHPFFVGTFLQDEKDLRGLM